MRWPCKQACTIMCVQYMQTGVFGFHEYIRVQLGLSGGRLLFCGMLVLNKPVILLLGMWRLFHFNVEYATFNVGTILPFLGLIKIFGLYNKKRKTRKWSKILLWMQTTFFAPHPISSAAWIGRCILPLSGSHDRSAWLPRAVQTCGCTGWLGECPSFWSEYDIWILPFWFPGLWSRFWFPCLCSNLNLNICQVEILKELGFRWGDVLGDHQIRHAKW